MNQNYNTPTLIVNITGVDTESEKLFERAVKAQFFKQMPTPKEAFLFLMHGFNVVTFSIDEEGERYDLATPEYVNYQRLDNSATMITFSLPLGSGRVLSVSCEYDSNGKPIIDGVLV